MTHNVCTRNQKISEKEVSIHSLKFASLLVKRIMRRTLKALKNNFILLKRSILVLKISQVKDDKAKHT